MASAAAAAISAASLSVIYPTSIHSSMCIKVYNTMLSLSVILPSICIKRGMHKTNITWGAQKFLVWICYYSWVSLQNCKSASANAYQNRFWIVYVTKMRSCRRMFTCRTCMSNKRARPRKWQWKEKSGVVAVVVISFVLVITILFNRSMLMCDISDKFSKCTLFICVCVFAGW